MFFSCVGHVQVRIHPGLEHGDAAELLELGGVGVVVEGAGDEDVEVGVRGFAGGGDQVGAGDGAEFRADEDGGALLGRVVAFAFKVTAFGTDEFAGPAGEGGEGDAVFLVRLPEGALGGGKVDVPSGALGVVGVEDGFDLVFALEGFGDGGLDALAGHVGNFAVEDLSGIGRAGASEVAAVHPLADDAFELAKEVKPGFLAGIAVLGEEKVAG